VRLGQAHCKIATLQEAFALSLATAYVPALERAAEEIREYDAERKALETRRYVPHPLRAPRWSSRGPADGVARTG
jgi:hypothetical protein